jgi:hypothetical protein
MDASLSIYMVVLLSCGMGIWAVRELLVAEANQQLPENQKIRPTVLSRTGLKGGDHSSSVTTHCSPVTAH